MYGIDVQRRLASGDGLWSPIGIDRIGAELQTNARQLQFLALGSHDTSDEVLDLAEKTFGDRFQRVVAGEPIRVIASTAGAPRP